MTIKWGTGIIVMFSQGIPNFRRAICGFNMILGFASMGSKGLGDVAGWLTDKTGLAPMWLGGEAGRRVQEGSTLLFFLLLCVFDIFHQWKFIYITHTHTHIPILPLTQRLCPWPAPTYKN